jgi:hypothetical protein
MVSLAGMASLGRMQNTSRAPLLLVEHVLIDGPDAVTAAALFAETAVSALMTLRADPRLLLADVMLGDWDGAEASQTRFSLADARRDPSALAATVAEGAMRGRACVLEGFVVRSTLYCRFRRVWVLYFRESYADRCARVVVLDWHT